MIASSPYDLPLFEAQLALEENTLVAARSEFWREVEAHKAEHTEGQSGHGAAFLKQRVSAVTTGIQAIKDKAKNAGRGRPMKSVKYINQLPADVCAFIALKTVLDGISSQKPVTAVAIAVADAIEDEVRLEDFKKFDFKKFKLTRDRLEKQSVTHRERRKTVMRLMAGRAGVVHDNWPKVNRLHLGMTLIDVVMATTKMVEVKIEGAGRSKMAHLVATAETLTQIATVNNMLETMKPSYLPMIVPPKRWTTPFNGGYWTGLARKVRLVKTRSDALVEGMKGREMPDVYASLNAVQETAWRVNRSVQEVLQVALDTGHMVGGLPSSSPADAPPKPADIATNEEAKKAWKKAASLVHSANRKEQSKRMQVSRTNDIARQFSTYESIYFPHVFDFRGRMYPVPLFLHPQGPDYCKSLLEFSHGKAITTPVAAGWLGIHGANLFGIDKVSFDERLAWVTANEDAIIATAGAPWDHLDFWTGADSPWCFLAFCFDWAGFQREGYGYVSHLPVALDGSCNGLQHYSAALRDAVGGAATNLLPSETPNDIYAQVANECVGSVTAMVRASADPGSPAWFAAKWLTLGITRKSTKRAVMTLPYGSTLYSCREFIEEALREQLYGKESPFAHRKQLPGSEEWIDTDGLFDASLFLQPVLWAAIGRVVHAAREAMDWLKDCAKAVSSQNAALRWETPDGFPVVQDYRNTLSRKIESHLDGSIFQPRLSEDTDKIDTRRMANGVAPNFVHSLDGCALRMFVNYASENGMDSFGLIHDSYATVAADVELMSACIRSAFVDLYDNHDVLAEFRASILPMLPEADRDNIPEVPVKGDLDIQAVRSSDFFFA